MDEVTQILEYLEVEAEAYLSKEKSHTASRRYALATEYWARWHTVGLLMGWIHKEFSVGAIDERRNRGVVTKWLARRFITAREDLLKAMYIEAATRVELEGGNVVEWDENLGIGGELYVYRKMAAVPEEAAG